MCASICVQQHHITKLVVEHESDGRAVQLGAVVVAAGDHASHGRFGVRLVEVLYAWHIMYNSDALVDQVFSTGALSRNVLGPLVGFGADEMNTPRDEVRAHLAW